MFLRSRDFVRSVRTLGHNQKLRGNFGETFHLGILDPYSEHLREVVLDVDIAFLMKFRLIHTRAFPIAVDAVRPWL